MQRIATPNATPQGTYDNGNPFQNRRGTIVSAQALTALQEEVAHVCEANGIVLDPTDNTQLLQAIQAMQGLTAVERRFLRAQAFEHRAVPFIPGQRTPHVLLAMNTCHGGSTFGHTISGSTPAAPTDATSVDGGDWEVPASLEPGHCWPYLPLICPTVASTSSGRWPICPRGWDYNAYRYFASLERETFVEGAVLDIDIALDLNTSDSLQMLEIVFHPNLITSCDGAGVNTTAFDPNLRFGFQFDLPTLATREARLKMSLTALGPSLLDAVARLTIGNAAINSPDIAGTTASTVYDRGPLEKDLSAGGINFARDRVELAALFKTDKSSNSGGPAMYTIGAVTSTQNGNVARARTKSALVLLYPGGGR